MLMGCYASATIRMLCYTSFPVSTLVHIYVRKHTMSSKNNNFLEQNISAAIYSNAIDTMIHLVHKKIASLSRS